MTASGGARSLHGYLTRQIWLCSLPLVMLAAYLAADSVMTALDDRDRAAANLVENVVIAIDRSLTSRISGLQMLAAASEADDAARAEEFYLDAQAFKWNFGGNVVLTDAALVMRFDTFFPFGAKLPPLPRPAGHAAAPAALETQQPAVGDAVVSPISGKRVVAIAVPVVRDGKAVALVLNVIETRELQGLLDQVALPAEWSLKLRDGQGEVIAHRAPPRFDSIAEVDESGRYVLASRLSPWSVVLEIPRNSQRTPLYAVAVALVLAVAGATLVSVVGGQFASRRLGRAVAALADSADSAAPQPDIAEIATVRRTLDDMGARRAEAEALLRATQTAALDEQRRARLAALNLMEDAVDARARTEAALAALRESEGRLAHALTATEEAVWDYDIDSQRVTYTRRWFEMLGLPDDELVRPVEFRLGLIYPDDLDIVRARIEAAWQGDGRYAAEYRLRHAGGRCLWVSDHGRVVERAADGRPLRMVGACADITQRRQLETERYALSEALRQSTQPLLLVDQGLRITYLNPAFTRLFGDRQEDLTGALVTSLLEPNEAGLAEHAEILRCLEECGNWSGETHRLGRDGTPVPVFASVGQIRDAGGHPAGFVSSYLDLRPLREKEDRLAHSAKLATVGEFAAGLAHELAHPVAVIRLAAECALDHSLDSEVRDEFLHEQIELVDDQAKRMAAQIEHIRAFSRKGGAPDQSFTPQAVITTVVQMIVRQLDIDGIDLTARTCDTVVALRGNPLRLEEAILNLISNARAAILARPAAADGRGEITLSCDCRGDRVVLTVRDNGVGIAATARDRVFEPFFTTKGVGEGLGLGLSISSTIAKSFGGELSFESEPGRTTFSLRVPISG